ncbi:hypothetical protein DPMN_084998 [Dreissena polymorpha]|uniref:Uncharacterized protein n=1 Tax=Dreissena polymorpha TaxID=45954 RepID=A0A9D3YEV2_DREPO|nr:hypothetical protein DPMN_084998 [Dreissena polymorpha]
MDAHKTIVLVAPADFAQLDALVSGWLPDEWMRCRWRYKACRGLDFGMITR